MAPGRKRGGKGAKTKSELSLGDLVLAKVKGFPAWPAKISRPEEWDRAPDPKKYFVQFFGTEEIAFVAPADIQAFTSESKNKLSARCQGKTVKYFAQAVKEICEEFDLLQQKKTSSIRDDNNAQNLASDARSASVDDEIDTEGLKCKLEIDGLGNGGSEFGRSQRKGAMGFQDVKTCLSGDINHSSLPSLSPGKKNKLSLNPFKPVKDSELGDISSSHASVKEEVYHNVKVEGGCSDGGQSELANNGHQSTLAMGLKRKREGTVQMKYASGGNMNVSSADNSKLGSDLDSGKKVKKLVKEKKHSVAVDGRVVPEVISEEHHGVSSNKMKIQHDHGKQTSRTIEASCPAKISKSVDVVDDTKMVRAQTSRKNEHISPVNMDNKMDNKEPKRLTSDGKAENHQSLRADKSNNESNHPTTEDDSPATKRHCLAGGMMSTSDLISESINGNSASSRSGLANPNKVQSSGMQLPTKRRAVRLCDDPDDELPKTPVHGGVSQKASAIPPISDSKKKTIKHEEGLSNDRLVSRKPRIIVDSLKEQLRYSRLSKQTSSLTAQKGLEKRTKETSPEHISPNHCQLDSKKSPFMETKSAMDLTQSVTAAKPLAEPQKKHLSKTPVSISQKKVPSGANRGLNTTSDGSTLDQLINERSKPTSTGEKMKTTPLSDSQINDSVISVGNPNESITTLGERLDDGSDSKTSFTVNSKISDSVTSMKHLIAAAQARKKQAHLQNSYVSHFPLGLLDADMLGRSPSSTPVELSNTLQLDVQRLHPNPPSSDVQLSYANGHEYDEFEERRVSSGHQVTGSSLSGDTEAAVARDAFEGMIETLSRTKESIGRATRLAIDCAKYGIANEVVELLIRKLENEPSLHRKVDLFFLVDSITQCSHNQKGIAGASYLPIIQAALPRLLGTAAPPGTGAHENRRQCHKVLRLWLERKILPESVIRRFMDDIGARNDETSAGISHRRPSRAERAIDDPIRDMEGMFVDEYGSNATFQLAGLLPSHFFDEEDDEDEGNFPTQHKEVRDTSPSGHHTPLSRDPKDCTVTPSDRGHCVLEEVDGELEMEDVSAQQKEEEPFSGNDTAQVALHEPNSDGIFQSASSMSEFLPSPEGSPPLPPGSPPESPPLPHSPPPPPPPSSPSPPPAPPPTLLDQHLFPPPPPPPAAFLSEKSLPHQPALMPQHMHHLPPTISSSQPVTYHPPPLQREIGGTPTVTQHVHMVSNTHGSRIDAPVRGEIYSQQSSFFSPAAVSNVKEHVGYNGYNSSGLVEYGQNDGYLNTQAPQQTQTFRSGSAPFVQRPLHPEQMTQQVPSHISYPNTAQQNMYPPYSGPNISDGLRRTTDEQWCMQGNEFNSDGSRRVWVTRGRSCSGLPYSNEGHFGGPLGRPPTNVVSFQPSGANSIPVAPISAHGSHMMPSRPDVSAVNWRPA